MSKWSDIARPMIFGVLSIGFFGITAYLLLSNVEWSSAGRGGVAFLAAVSCALIAYLDRFESLKASVSGIEAKTREVRQVVDEARTTISELHKLAELTGAFMINMMSGIGRWDGYPPKVIERNREEIVDVLKAIGLADQAVARVAAADEEWINIDYSIGIINRLRRTEHNSKMTLLGDEMISRWNEEGFRPSPEDFDEAFKNIPITNDEVLELLRDYRHYMTTRTHRRPEVWLNRKNWEQG